MRKQYNMKVLEPESKYNFDLFIISANVNLRGLCAYRQLIDNGSTIKKTVVLDFDFTRPNDNLKGYEDNYNEYLELPNSEVVVCHGYNDCSDYISKIDIDNGDSIGFDITGFLIPDLFKTFYVLDKIQKINSIDVFYTEADRYNSSNLFKSYKYFSGELNCQVINEFHLSSNKNDELLVIFLGFDQNISNYVNDYISPGKTVVVNGFPAYYQKHKDRSIINNYELISKIDIDNIYYTVANNPYSAYNTLCQIQRDHKNYVINVCALGNRPMALGACLYALKHTDNVKVVFPYPKKYEFDESISSNTVWNYHINFK